MNPPERELAAWAADCAERVLDRLGADDQRARTALATVRAWVAGSGSPDASLDAAFLAQSAARDALDAGYEAVAAAYRAVANAAASVGEPELAGDAARLAIEALTLNSAVCEAQPNADAERRRQWEALPQHLRPLVFDTEPPGPGPAACAV